MDVQTQAGGSAQPRTRALYVYPLALVVRVCRAETYLHHLRQMRAGRLMRRAPTRYVCVYTHAHRVRTAYARVNADKIRWRASATAGITE
jgi:hypothetical protein